jgi:hypothetical protein
MITNRAIDLNIFYREEWDEVSGRAFTSENIFIDVYDYWQYTHPDHGLCSDHAELGVLIECTPEETAVLRRAYPEQEYGHDWWIHYNEAVLPVMLHEKIQNKLRTVTIPVVR